MANPRGCIHDVRGGSLGARLLEAGIPVGEINSLDKALSNPQIVEREMVAACNEDGDEIKVAGNPLNYHSSKPNTGIRLN